MLLSDVPPHFEREHGSTEAEWLRALPRAAEGRAQLSLPAPGRAEFALHEGGTLRLDWSVLEPRRIALITLPRLRVVYRFDDTVDAVRRQRFLRGFDLVMQRGGG